MYWLGRVSELNRIKCRKSMPFTTLNRDEISI
jgi:hypothetical protein